MAGAEQRRHVDPVVAEIVEVGDDVGIDADHECVVAAKRKMSLLAPPVMVSLPGPPIRSVVSHECRRRIACC